MSAELSFDMTRLRTLHEELRRLNEAALANGLFEDLDSARRVERRPAVTAEPAVQAPPEGKAVKSRAAKGNAGKDRGKAAAARLIALAGRTDDDNSADVPGTKFTEDGVVRLLARLRRRPKDREGAWPRFLTRAHRALTRRVPIGRHTIGGISLARLQSLSVQLAQIEANGLTYVEARRGAQRGRVSQAGTLMVGGGPLAAGDAPGEERLS